MVYLERIFKSFVDSVYISNSSPKAELLRKSRDHGRERIKDYFRVKEWNMPQFCMQGSFEMNTIITPIDGEYDLDDGVYLTNLPAYPNNWPSPSTVHNWIKEAVTGITQDEPIDKDTCVRLIYKRNYHIDYPVYGIYGSNQYLFHKKSFSSKPE